MFDLIIIGGGPAGVSAGVYAARKRLTTCFITKDWGGQSIVSPDIQNWIGTPSISGDKLAADLKGHLMSYAGEYVTVKSGSGVASLTRGTDSHTVTLENGEIIEARAILIASGSARRHLTVPGADIYEHKGLTYCASCDGPLFAGQDVAVIGGGNAGFETAAQLLAYTKSVTLISHSDFKADAITVEKVVAHPNMTAIAHAEPVEVHGETFVNGLTYRTADGATTTLPVTGIFVEIGMIPNTTYAKDAVTVDAYGRVEIDPWTQRTTTPGIWAAGDCTNVKYHQNNIAAGDAVRALEDIYVTLKAR
ncbi:MAG: FAD-dependent oxidoreductase [Candidatus Pacebacteria bacterium]|jgi:alkyl hydroperoxide reductase subunit F|nr:FAD-dependent oxidoreductase [Candidatus Paceibacterota bacterium]